jgi:hypothetical protein
MLLFYAAEHAAPTPLRLRKTQHGMLDIFVVVRNVQAAAYCRQSSFLREMHLPSRGRGLVEVFWRARSFVCQGTKTKLTMDST